MQWEIPKVYRSFCKEGHSEQGANPNFCPFLSIVFSEKCPFHISQSDTVFPCFWIAVSVSGQDRNSVKWMNTLQLKRWLLLLHYHENSLSPHTEIRLKVTKVAEGDMRAGSCNYIMPTKETFHLSLYLFAFRFHQDTAWTISPRSSYFICSWFYFSSDLSRFLSGLNSPPVTLSLSCLTGVNTLSVLCTEKGIKYFDDTSREIQLEEQWVAWENFW